MANTKNKVTAQVLLQAAKAIEQQLIQLGKNTRIEGHTSEPPEIRVQVQVVWEEGPESWAVAYESMLIKLLKEVHPDIWHEPANSYTIELHCENSTADGMQ